jgi:hypothetical protein
VAEGHAGVLHAVVLPNASPKTAVTVTHKVSPTMDAGKLPNSKLVLAFVLG